MKKYLSSLILLVAASYHIANAETVFKVIDLKYQMAQYLLPTLQTLVGNDGVVTGLNNQLIIRVDSSRMPDVEKAIAALDKIRHNLKITVDYASTKRNQQDDTSVQGDVKIGSFIISNSRRLPQNTAQMDVERNIGNMSDQNREFINVLEGERAFIRTGQIVPYTQEWVLLTRHYIQAQQTTEFRDISTGFSVSARSVGDESNSEFELEIMPHIASLTSSGYVDFEELRTMVRIHKGEWFDLSKTMMNKDNVSRQILNFHNQSSKQNTSLRIRID